MSGQVTVGDKRWAVGVARTPSELSLGLSGVPSIAPYTGILFDLGYDQSSLQIDMSRMLFPLDIIFINSTQGIVGVLRNVQPGEDTHFEAATTLGARWFLEVNAGEAEGIAVGDSVDLGQPEQGIIQPAFWVTFLNVMTAVIIGLGAYRELRRPKEPEVPREKEVKK